MRKTLKLFAVVLAAAALLVGCKSTAAVETTTETTQAVITTMPEATATAAETTTAVPETTTAAETEPAPAKEPVTILYINDIHSYVCNTVKDKDGNTKPGIRLSSIVSYRDKLEAEGKHVLLVESGDDISGCVYGIYDKGETVLGLMKAAGFQAAAIGNHDYDYGVDHLLELKEKLDYPFLSCNFRDSDGNLLFDSTKIFETGGVKIGFIGVTTPVTFTTSTPTFFQDKDGNFIYSFDGISDPEELYASVQAAVDSIRSEVDYVIVLSHLGCGIDEIESKNSSFDVAANTTGIDAILDGHSHTTLEKQMIENKEGKEVLVTQTGCYLGALGQLEIAADGTMDSHLITEGLDEADATLAEAEEAFNASVDEAMGQKIATLETKLYTNDPEVEGRRLVRARETNLGDFVTDGIYWFFNQGKEIPCDVVLLNGGAIRAELNAGDITQRDIKTVQPFNNQICMIRTRGQDIIDALEMGAKLTGGWDNEWDCPAEYGGFMQVAGIRYTIDAAIPSSVVLDENNMFVKVDGEYRVKDVQVYNRETKQYEPIDPEGSYTLGGINYNLRNKGDGFCMFADDPAVVDFVGSDDSVLTAYFKAFDKNGDYAYVITENSPLKVYENYLLDYKNPSGSGRITILNVDR